MTLNGLPFYDPRTQAYLVQGWNLRMEANLIATLSFTVYPDNPRYDSIAVRNTLLRIYSDDELILVMRPVRLTETLKGGVTVYCEEMLGALADVSQNVVGEWGAVNTVAGRVSIIIAASPRLSADYRVSATQNITTAFDADLAEENTKFALSEPQSALDLLRSQTCDKFPDGFLFAEYYDEYMKVCFLTESELPQGAQAIEYGKNLQEFSRESNADDFFTRLIPLGADTATTAAQQRDGAPQSRPLTIYGQAVPDYDDPQGDTSVSVIDIHSGSAETAYGVKTKIVRFDEIKSASALFRRGWAYFGANYGRATKTVNLKAVDLHFADSSIPALKFLTRVPVKVPHLGVNTEYLIKRMNLSASPGSSTVELGEVKKSFTDLSSQSAKAAATRFTTLNSRVYGLEH